MIDGTWEAIYASEWQAVWALWAAPIAFLLFRARRGPPTTGVVPEATAFVDRYCVAFAVATLVDPFCTTLVVRWLGWSGGPNATAVGLFFVLLGDFRVFLLVFGLPGPGSEPSDWRPALLRALLLTAAVPVAAYAIYASAQQPGSPLAARWLWLTHESLFVALALGLRGLWLPHTPERAHEARVGFLRGVLAYAAFYYALWAVADIVILAGWDAGFGLRIVPNQLYYAFWIPFVWWRFTRQPLLR